MRAVFRCVHTAITDFKHIGIRPPAGFRELREIALRKPDRRHRLPRITNINGGSPQITANEVAPLTGIVAAILAQAEDNLAARLLKRLTHPLVDGAHVIVLPNAGGAAPVVLQVVDTPSG